MKVIIATTLLSLLIVACAAETDELENGKGGKNKSTQGDDDDGTAGDDDTVDPQNLDPTQPGSCKEGVPHPGFANFDFVSDRKPGAIGDNRRRVKPFSALSSEFDRALGRVPANLVTNRAAFGEAPARWFSEPQAGAVSLATTYTMAFTACFESMTGAEFGAAPTEATATEQCTKLQRKIWQRSPSPEEIAGCKDLVVGLTTETVARRRWAHGCASVMTSSGFITY